MPETIDRLTAALFDRYTIERELGAGGMATVHLFHNVKHDRRVTPRNQRKPATSWWRTDSRRI